MYVVIFRETLFVCEANFFVVIQNEINLAQILSLATLRLIFVTIYNNMPIKKKLISRLSQKKIPRINYTVVFRRRWSTLDSVVKKSLESRSSR